MTFLSLIGREWKVRLLHYTKKWHPNMPSPLLPDDPISWQSNGADDLTSSVRGCTGNLRLTVDGKSITREQFDNFFNTKELTDIRIELYYELTPGQGTFSEYPIFQGFVKTEAAEQPLQPYPYDVELTIVDALAAGEEIRPSNFMERCAPLGYRFSMKNLLDWWREDMDIEYLQVVCTDLMDLEYPRPYASDFMEITENINMTPHNLVRASTYKEIFEKMLGSNRMFFLGDRIMIDTNLYLRNDYIIRCRRWSTFNSSTLTDIGTYDIHPQTLLEKYQPRGSEHSVKRIPKRMTYCVRPSLRKEDVSLSIDFDKNYEIKSESTTEGTLWGQGNLITHSVGMTRGKRVNVDKASMKASVEDNNGWLVVSPNNGEESITLRTLKPVCFGAVDKMLLTGSLVQKELIRESFADQAVYKTVSDYDNVLEFSLQWGKFYSNGGERYHSNERPGWTTTVHRMEMKMMKDYQNSDTSNFFDPKTDPTPKEETAFSKMFVCEDNEVANYEGYHILSSPAIIEGVDPRLCDYITLYIYGTNAGSTNISGLSLKSVNEKAGEYVYGDIVNGDEIEYMPEGDSRGIWNANGHPAATIVKFSDMGIFEVVFGLMPIIYDSDLHYQITGYTFSPIDEVGDLSLVTFE